MPGESPWYIRLLGKYTALVYMTLATLVAIRDLRETPLMLLSFHDQKKPEESGDVANRDGVVRE
ncbi:hypothetical protein MKX07_004802 [Trichoderma sp. CBMAI-0711]|nr:hypothetical protein MKX07_004802 [Trichoderma sp. CBMAI-0711]